MANRYNDICFESFSEVDWLDLANVGEALETLGRWRPLSMSMKPSIASSLEIPERFENLGSSKSDEIEVRCYRPRKESIWHQIIIKIFVTDYYSRHRCYYVL